MEKYNQFKSKYLKVKKVIESCTSMNHIAVTEQMIENLATVGLREHLPYEFYGTYINNLKFYLKLKTDELTEI